MIFDDAIDEVKEQEQEPEKIIVLATVTSLTNGKALVQFNGETSPATKAYPFIEGYKPAVNDVVCMLKQGNTFVIIGKVSNDNITTNYNAQKSELDSAISGLSSTYLSKTDASSTYLSKTDASSTYLSQTSASSTYLSKTDASSTYLSKTDASSTYLSKTDASSTYLKKTDASNTYLSQTDASSTYLKKTDASNTYLERNDLRWSGRNLYNRDVYAKISLGMNGYPFGAVYADNFYGTVNSTSDRRLKKSIKTLGRRWLDFFYKLRPTSFKYKDGESGRTHTGFIAQEVEEAAKDAGIERQDIAAIVVDKDGRYYLRYEELIAVQTLAIHNLSEQIADLRARVIDLERSANR